MIVEMQSIGAISTPYKSKDQAPIQGAYHPDVSGVIEVLPEYEEGLLDIEGFSHLIVLWVLDRAATATMTRVPFLSDQPHGLWACRHPARPNPIGLTVVTLEKREGARLTVGGVDMLDGTPVLDIKPYVPQFDSFPDAVDGWFQGRGDRPKPPGRE
jgi:tRNA (adenine37-N6)-methyltransferase